MDYVPFINITLLHEFFESETMPDFRLYPTEATQRVLDGNRIIFKEKPDGFKTYIQVNAGGFPYVSLDPYSVLSFWMVLENTDAPYYTLLPDFVDFMILTLDNKSDLIGPVLGILMTPIEEVEHEIPTETEVKALINLYSPNAFPIDGENFHQIDIIMQSTFRTWAYYLITDDTVGDYQLIDTTVIEPFLSFTKTDLIATPDPADETALLLATQYPGSHLYRFTSDTAVAYREKGRQFLQLQKDGASLIDNLPNPDIHSNGVKILNINQINIAL